MSGPFGHLCTAVTVLLLSAQEPAAAGPYGPIDPDRMSRDIQILASDEFEGRAPGTPGETRTIEYLVKEFEALGLEPGGVDGGWTQPLTLIRLSHDGPVTAALDTPSGNEALTHGEHLVVNSATESGIVAIKDAPLVFAGYGIHAPELGWDDLAGMDLKGKVAIVLRGEPDGAPFDGAELSKHGTIREKLAALATKGASGVLLLTPGGKENWTMRANSALVSQYTMESESPPLLFTGSVNYGWVKDVLNTVGLDVGELTSRAAAGAFRAIAVPDVALDLAFRMRREPVTTHNVLARLPGTERPDETVIYLAHWDHLGRGIPDESGDDIYNGAIDNASGIAGLLEIARAFSKGPAPERSVVFLAITAEELGLWGVRHYVAAPVYSLGTTAVALNMDVLSMIGPAHRVQIVGYGKTTLDSREVPAAVARQGRVLDRTKGFGGTLYNRSDHIVLARDGGVPVLFLGWGTELTDPWPLSDTEYMSTRYHTPKDEWWPGLDLRGAAQTVELLYLVGRQVANSSDWPEWQPHSEFRALREESAAARDGGKAKRK